MNLRTQLSRIEAKAGSTSANGSDDPALEHWLGMMVRWDREGNLDGCRNATYQRIYRERGYDQKVARERAAVEKVAAWFREQYGEPMARAVWYQWQAHGRCPCALAGLGPVDWTPFADNDPQAPVCTCAPYKGPYGFSRESWEMRAARLQADLKEEGDAAVFAYPTCRCGRPPRMVVFLMYGEPEGSSDEPEIPA